MLASCVIRSHSVLPRSSYTNVGSLVVLNSCHCPSNAIGPAVRADFRRLYPANAKTPTCCPSDDNRTKVTNSVTSARSLWWHVGPYFWPADLTRTANPIRPTGTVCLYYVHIDSRNIHVSSGSTSA